MREILRMEEGGRKERENRKHASRSAGASHATLARLLFYFFHQNLVIRVRFLIKITF